MAAITWRYRIAVPSAMAMALALMVAAAGSSPAAEDLMKELDSTDQPAATPTQQVAPMRSRTAPSQDEFVPLLAPRMRPSVAASRSANIFHGNLRTREIYNHLYNGTNDLVSRLESKGSLDRIQGKAVSLVWNGQLAHRTGTSYTTAEDYHHARLRMFEASLFEKFDGGSAREGRFLPNELAGIGYIDGIQVQDHLTNQLQGGFDAGLRPDRRQLEPSIREPIASAYMVYESGTHGELYYEGTLGLYQTLFDGVADETALLYDQRSDFGPKLNLSLTSQVNFNTGAALVNTEKARLTRADLYVLSPLTSYFSLRAGLNHFELPDTAAQRDLLGGTTEPFVFQSTYWRYWVGSTQELPWQLQLDEEAGLISTHGQPDSGQARGTISRQGFFLPQARVSLTVYTLNQIDSGGLGGILGAMFPLMENRLNLTANAGSRYTSPPGESKTFELNDASLYLYWLITRAWTLNLGISQTYLNSAQSTLADFSLSYHW